MYNTTTSLIALRMSKEKRLIEKFIKSGAISEENAISLEQVGIKKDSIFDRMVDRGIFIQCQSGKYYMDDERVSYLMGQRQKRIIATLVIFAIIIILYYVR